MWNRLDYVWRYWDGTVAHIIVGSVLLKSDQIYRFVFPFMKSLMCISWVQPYVCHRFTFKMKFFPVAYTSPSEVSHTCITQAYTIAHILNIPLASTLHNFNLHLISQGCLINPLISANIIDTPLSPFWIQCNVRIHIISHPRTLLITSTIHLIVLQEQLFS